MSVIFNCFQPLYVNFRHDSIKHKIIDSFLSYYFTFHTRPPLIAFNCLIYLFHLQVYLLFITSLLHTLLSISKSLMGSHLPLGKPIYCPCKLFFFYHNIDKDLLLYQGRKSLYSNNLILFYLLLVMLTFHTASCFGIV